MPIWTQRGQIVLLSWFRFEGRVFEALDSSSFNKLSLSVGKDVARSSGSFGRCQVGTSVTIWSMPASVQSKDIVGREEV